MSSVTVLTATKDRQFLLPRLVACFQAQTAASSLIVLDNSKDPSPFMLKTARRSKRISYLHDPVVVSLGMARNWLAAHAKTDYVAFFDDDDFYSASYCATMAQHLHQSGADLVKLNAWFVYQMQEKELFYWDTRRCIKDENHFEVGKGPTRATLLNVGAGFVEETVLGYGFSWVCKRDVFQKVQCEDHNFSEDFKFVKALKRAGGRVFTVPDTEGISTHIIHGTNGSWCYPQYRIPQKLIGRVVPGLLDWLREDPS